MLSSKEIVAKYWLGTGGSLLFFLTIAIYAFTNEYMVLAVPFVLAIAAMAILNLKAFYWLILFTIPFSATIYFLGQSLSTTVPDEPLTWVLLAITVLIVAFNPKQFPQWFFRNPITLVITLQLVWMMITVAFSQNVFISLKYAVSRLWLINAFFFFPVLVFKEKKDFKKAFLFLMIPITLHAMFAFGWHYTKNFHYWISNVVVRPFYFNHVDYSTVLSMLFPVLYVSWKLSKGKKFLRWFIIAVIAFYIPAIYVASARAAILAVMFAFFIAFMIERKWVKWLMPTAYAFLIGMVFFLAHNNYYLNFTFDKRYNATQTTFTDAVTGMFTGKDMSSAERFYRWIASVRMSTERPIVGVGPNNFYENYKSYAVPVFATWVSRNEERSTTHNYFLFMLVEQGWPAMILYGILIALIFAYAQKIYHRSKDPYHKRLIMGAVMLVAAGFVNNFFSELIDTHKVGAIFYLGVATIVILGEWVAKEETNNTPATNVTSIDHSEA